MVKCRAYLIRVINAVLFNIKRIMRQTVGQRGYASCHRNNKSQKSKPRLEINMTASHKRTKNMSFIDNRRQNGKAGFIGTFTKPRETFKQISNSPVGDETSAGIFLGVFFACCFQVVIIVFILGRIEYSNLVSQNYITIISTTYTFCCLILFMYLAFLGFTRKHLHALSNRGNE